MPVLLPEHLLNASVGTTRYDLLDRGLTNALDCVERWDEQLALSIDRPLVRGKIDVDVADLISHLLHI